MDSEQTGGSRTWRIVLVVLIGIASLNLWTGGPLFALWVGSRTQASGSLTMIGVFVVSIVLTAVSLALIRLIAVLQEAYRKQSGVTPQVRAHTPWLRSMRGERPVYPGENAQLTAPERMLVFVVVVAIAVFEVWFFFFSGSPIDQRSGRGERPVQLAAASVRGDVVELRDVRVLHVRAGDDLERHRVHRERVSGRRQNGPRPGGGGAACVLPIQDPA